VAPIEGKHLPKASPGKEKGGEASHACPGPATLHHAVDRRFRGGADQRPGPGHDAAAVERAPEALEIHGSRPEGTMRRVTIQPSGAGRCLGARRGPHSRGSRATNQAPTPGWGDTGRGGPWAPSQGSGGRELGGSIPRPGFVNARLLGRGGHRGGPHIPSGGRHRRERGAAPPGIDAGRGARGRSRVECPKSRGTAAGRPCAAAWLRTGLQFAAPSAWGSGRGPKDALVLPHPTAILRGAVPALGTSGTGGGKGGGLAAPVWGKIRF